MLTTYENFFLYLWRLIMQDPLFTLLLSVCILFFSLTLLVFYRKKLRANEIKPRLVTKKQPMITSHDIKAIAGDNVMSTQLDLARAYMEMDKKKLAKKILTHVLEKGDIKQKVEAQRLISIL